MKEADSTIDISSDTHEPASFTPALYLALDNWVDEGQVLVNLLLSQINKDNLIRDEVMNTILFSVLGSYSYIFSLNYKETKDIPFSHSKAITQLMNNPQISKLVEGYMHSQVSKKVGEMV